MNVPETAFAVVATTALPFALVRATYDAEFRASVPERLGYGSWRELNLSPGEELIWLHGASVGEIQGVVPVARALEREFPRLGRLISTTSTTGRSEVLKQRIARHAALLPYDHPLIVGKVLRRSAVRLFVMFETEIWPNLLFSLRSQRIPVVLVNARISDNSYPRYLKLKRFFAPALASLDQVLAQTELDRERFVSLGVDSGRATVCGSTKYDIGVPSEVDLKRFHRTSGIDPERPCFVAGSVRPGEDEEILAAFVELRHSIQGLQMIIAPRHPEGNEKIRALFQQRGIPFAGRSTGESAAASGVLLLDTLGELRAAYSMASFSFVGGTLVPIGGHNPLEPAMFGAPVLVGPHVSNVRDAVAQLMDAGGAKQISGSNELVQVGRQFLLDEPYRRRSGEAARSVWQGNCGATTRVLDVLRTYVKR